MRWARCSGGSHSPSWWTGRRRRGDDDAAGIAGLSAEWPDGVLALQKTVVDFLACPEPFSPASRDYLEDPILRLGRLLGAIVEDRPVACQGAKLILSRDDTLGRDVGLLDAAGRAGRVPGVRGGPLRRHGREPGSR